MTGPQEEDQRASSSLRDMGVLMIFVYRAAIVAVATFVSALVARVIRTEGTAF